MMICFIFFFFKQKTAYEMRISDWSSDVCSSDLSTSTSSAQTGLGSGADLRLDALNQCLDRLCQPRVALRQSLRVVRRQQYVDAVIDVRPFGMMVHLLRDDRDARHESERLGEIPEPESPRDRIAFGLVRPVREAGEQRGARRLIEFLDHRFFSRW